MQFSDTRRRGAVHLTAGLALALAVSGCTLLGADDEPQPAEQDAPENAGQTSGVSPEGGEVVLVTHESFTLPDEVLQGFTEQTGLEVVVQASGDAGALTNQLVLTQGSPIGDAVFGIDNTFATRAVNEGVLSAYTPSDLPPEVSEHALPGDAANYLTPVDYGDVCINIDDAWFEAGPDRPDLSGPVRHLGGQLLQPRPGLSAGHHRRVRRGRLAGLLARPDGQRRRDHLRVVGLLRRRLHLQRGRPADRAVLCLQPALHHPRG